MAAIKAVHRSYRLSWVGVGLMGWRSKAAHRFHWPAECSHLIVGVWVVLSGHIRWVPLSHTLNGSYRVIHDIRVCCLESHIRCEWVLLTHTSTVVGPCYVT